MIKFNEITLVLKKKKINLNMDLWIINREGDLSPRYGWSPRKWSGHLQPSRLAQRNHPPLPWKPEPPDFRAPFVFNSETIYRLLLDRKARTPLEVFLPCPGQMWRGTERKGWIPRIWGLPDRGRRSGPQITQFLGETQGGPTAPLPCKSDLRWLRRLHLSQGRRKLLWFRRSPVLRNREGVWPRSSC